MQDVQDWKSLSEEVNLKSSKPFLLPTDAHNIKKRRVIKTF